MQIQLHEALQAGANLIACNFSDSPNRSANAALQTFMASAGIDWMTFSALQSNDPQKAMRWVSEQLGGDAGIWFTVGCQVTLLAHMAVSFMPRVLFDSALSHFEATLKEANIQAGDRERLKSLVESMTPMTSQRENIRVLDELLSFAAALTEAVIARAPEVERVA